ncbi:AroM family protein [Shimazuella kribbensis]|uniref:AroM family protein n=1 Tax=Shimazuella kribbensis TaxID=139808 RepID=UPI000416B63D|nr:AroM family protein [Shimazuella kribbensis]
MTKRIGIVTIGQAPRKDIASIFDAYFKDVEILQAGALDDLSKTEIDETMSPVDGDYVLTTRLVTGDSVVVAREKIEPLLQQKIYQLENASCDPILILCTGVFEDLRTNKSVLVEPDRVLPPVVAALVQNRKLGIIAPLVEQVGSIEGKWVDVDLSPLIAAASPYTGSRSDFEEAAKKLKEQGAQVLLLDCMGYDEQMREYVIEISGLPVILSNALIAKLMSELV